MKKDSIKKYVMQYLLDNYVDLTPITLREIAAAVKETEEEKIYKVLKDLKRMGQIAMVERMDSDHGSEVIIQMDNS